MIRAVLNKGDTVAGPTYGDELRRIVAQYQDAGQPWPASAKDIAAWALREKLWAPHPHALINQCAAQLADAMREDYIVDPQGRTVRAKHAARLMKDGQQLVLWADIRSADRRHMEIALQQRRQQIVGDCRQLKTDVDSFNENATPLRPIQMVFDFTQDLAELEALESLVA